jgi:hypothetical protein
MLLWLLVGVVRFCVEPIGVGRPLDFRGVFWVASAADRALDAILEASY